MFIQQTTNPEQSTGNPFKKLLALPAPDITVWVSAPAMNPVMLTPVDKIPLLPANEKATEIRTHVYTHEYMST